MRSTLWLSSCFIALMAVPTGAIAQESESPKGDAADPVYHREQSPEIIVTAPFQRDRLDILQGTSVLQGPELTQAIRPTIGETLQHTPGVSATSFGPSASRPILRGLQGERVRVLTDGIGSIDVSNTSVDHAVAVNPLLADRIEVLRGANALLYGSAAIGGVVNVIDKRIPLSVPDEPVHVDAIGTYGSAANERSGSAAVELPIGDRFVIHADGSYLKSGDMRIGSYALAPLARRQALASSLQPPAAGEGGDEPIDFAANAAIRDKLPNSAAKTWTAGVGAAFITDGGNLGVSYSHYDSLYGIPVRYATLPGQTQEAPRLDLKQNRIDARAEINADGALLKSIRFRFGYADYRHFELDESGNIGTAFYNKGMEGRLELVQADRGPWKGATGGQFFVRDFNVIGDEAFLPKSKTEQFGLFTLQQLDYGAFKLEGGARFEHTALRALPGDDQPQFFTGERTFDAFSGSVGASYGLSNDWRIGVNLSRTTRAPSAEELFANGPHAGTQAFEVGNPDFKSEKSWGVEAVLRGKGEGYSLEASAYYNWFSNFIYESLTGNEEDGLQVFQFNQGKARYYGFEVQGSVDVARFGDSTLTADALADYVHANIVNSGPAPRIPPLRLLGGLSLKNPTLDVRGEVEWVNDQKRITAFETPTESYTLVNAEINIRPWGADRPFSLALSANNIFDVDARRHSSFLKDFAPLSGRDFRVTGRVSF